MENIQWMSDADILLHLGNKIKEWRLQMNISQSELANRTLLSVLTIQKVEGGSGTSVSNLLRIMRQTGHLDLFDFAIKEPQISPVEYFEFQKKTKERKRASKQKTNDKDTDSSSLW